MTLAGIPRSLSFFYLFPLYRRFLEELGVGWIESPHTSEADLQRLDLCPTDEPCVAVKAAFCHVDRLLKAGADAILVPSVISLTRRAYCCPKMMGLPAMLKAGFDLPVGAIVSPVIDFRDGPGKWERSWIVAARMLGVRDERRARRALAEGIRAWKEHDRECAGKGRSLWDPAHRSARVTGVLGHSYILHDVFAQRVAEVAKSYGNVAMAEDVAAEEASAALSRVSDGDKLWSIEGHILGAAIHLMDAGLADRLIFVSAFSCGPASIIESYIAKEADKHGIPILNLAVDEHSGEAGLLTRLEAFMDSTVVGSKDCRSPASGAAVSPGMTSSGIVSTGKHPGRSAAAAPVDDGPVGLVDMGNLRYALRSLFLEMGTEAVMPPPLTEDIARLGKEIAPEFICYPMVTLIGQMRKHAENGVRKIIMIQGKGKCRLGWYAQVMEEILLRAGYPVRVLSIDSPLPLGEKWNAFAESYRALSGGASAVKGLRGLRMTLLKIAASDRAGGILRDTRAFEAERGEGDRRHARFLLELDEARSAGNIWAAFRRYARDMRLIPKIRTNPLRVAVVGEVYVVNEPFVNRDAERLLGSLEQRVLVRRTLDVSSWVDYHLLKLPKSVRSHNEIVRCASLYLPVDVGGHGQESVGEAVLAGKLGMDGVVHLFPFTCMPEIIAQNILVKVSKDLDMPVLSLMISEQTGLAGLTTRFEAFCDLLEGRRKAKTVYET